MKLHEAVLELLLRPAQLYFGSHMTDMVKVGSFDQAPVNAQIKILIKVVGAHPYKDTRRVQHEIQQTPCSSHYCGNP
jgi:hypothetical protein